MIVSQTALATQWRTGIAYVMKQEHWLCRYRNIGEVTYHYEDNPFATYLTSAYVAIQFFGGGTGVISPQNSAETALVFLFIVLGTLLWAVFVGAVCSIQTNIDEADQQYFTSLDRVNYLMSDLKLDPFTRRAAREYLKNTRAAIKRQSYPEVINCFVNSNKIHSSLAAGLGIALLHKVSYFKDLADEIDRPLFCDGDEVRVLPTRVIHVASGKSILRIEAGAKASAWESTRDNTGVRDTTLFQSVVNDTNNMTRLRLRPQLEQHGEIIDLGTDVAHGHRRFFLEQDSPSGKQPLRRAISKARSRVSPMRHDGTSTVANGRCGVRFANVRRGDIPEEEHSFLPLLALKLQRRVYGPKERIPATDLQSKSRFAHTTPPACLLRVANKTNCSLTPRASPSTAAPVVVKGVVGKNGQILNQGKIFGEDFIVGSENLRDRRPVTSMSFVETAALTRKDLDEICLSYPTCAAKIRRTAMVYALERALPHAAEYHAAHRSRKYPMGLLKGETRERWAAALDFVLNTSTEPLAVRKQPHFADRVQQKMLRHLVGITGQPLKKIETNKLSEMAVKGFIEAAKGSASSSLQSATLADVIDRQVKMQEGQERLSAEVRELKELLLHQVR